MKLMIAFFLCMLSYQPQSDVRRVLIFGNDNAKTAKQVSWLEADSEGLVERDIKVERITTDLSLYDKFQVARGAFAFS